MKSRITFTLVFPLLLLAFISPGNSPDTTGLELIMTAPVCKWDDTSDMQLQLKLVNNSSQPAQVFDQLFDDVYTYQSTPLDNLFFIAQIKENNEFEDYMDLPFIDQLLPNPWDSDLMIDSIKKIRSPYIELLPNDTASLVYSFSYGRRYPKGSYRIRARFFYGFKGMGNFVDSDWVYIEVINDYTGPRAQTIWETSKTLFWEKETVKKQ